MPKRRRSESDKIPDLKYENELFLFEEDRCSTRSSVNIQNDYSSLILTHSGSDHQKVPEYLKWQDNSSLSKSYSTLGLYSEPCVALPLREEPQESLNDIVASILARIDPEESYEIRAYKRRRVSEEQKKKRQAWVDELLQIAESL